MAIKLDEARIRLLNISGGITPTTNNSLNLGSSNYKWANVYATTFQGNATSASTLTSITTTDAASSSDVWRRLWMSYSNNTTGRPAYDDRFAIQTSTGTLKAPIFSGNLSGNATTATTATKLGSSTVGSTTKPIYLNAGTATASNATVGNTLTPVYMNGGTITATETFGNRLYDYNNARTYFYSFGGSQDLNWKKVFAASHTATAPSSATYIGATIKGTIYYHKGNYNQAEVDEYPFQMNMVFLSNTSVSNSCTLRVAAGCPDTIIRAVRVSTNSFELQVRQPADWTKISIQFSYSGSASTMQAFSPVNSSNSSVIAFTTLTNSRSNYSNVAAKLGRGGDVANPMVFNWSGQSGQPSWLWGGSDGTNMYVYNPSNFSVNYAASAGSVAWGNVTGKPSTYTPSSHTHNYITSKGATVANTRTPAYSESLITGGWASADAGYGSTYGTTLDVSGYSTWYHRLAFHTNGQIDYWMGINTTTLTKQGTLITSANYNNYAPSKTGTGASGTWGISISGNAATATNADKLDGYHASSFGINYSVGDANLNAQTNSGFYRLGGTITNGFTNAAWGQMLVVHGGGDTIGQIGIPYNESGLYVRQGNPSDVGGSGSWKPWVRLLDSNNYTSYTDSRYVNVSGDTMSGVLNAHGGITLNSSTAQGTLQYILGIKAFADGGNILWQTASDVTVGKANALTVNAGNAGQPVYFTGGVPTAIDWHIGNSGVGEHNCNNVTYNFAGYYTSNGPATSLGPTTNDGALWAQAYSSSWVAQIAQDYRDGSLYVRGKNSGTWMAWQNVILGNGYQNVGPIKLITGAGANNITTNYISAGRGYSTGSGLNGLKLVATEQDDAISGIGQDCTGKAYELSVAAAVGTSGQGYITFVGHKMASLSTYSELGHFNFANSTFYVNGKIGVGTTSPSYAVHAVGDVYANGGWLRSSGDTGWYNQSYGGGWYMADSTYVRSYSSKQVLIGNTLYIGTTAGGGTGLSLYGTSAPTLYGIHMSTTANYGKFGDVQSDWATYFNMNAVGQRGWIYRAGSTNVASISANGIGAFKGITTCNRGNSDGLYSNSGLEIREYNYSGTGSDTWGQAPRLSFHWSGKVAAQIGLASNGYLYTAPSTGTTFYKLVYESGTWGIGISGNAATATVAATLGKSGGTTGPMKFYWSGQSGQPSWLWGGNDGTNMYVYNPSNFSVNYATSAGSASSATTATTASFLTNCYAYDGNSSYASYPWHKVATVTTTSGYADFTITFLVTKGMEGTSGGILRARLRTNGSALCESAQLYWLQASNLNASDFVGVYTNGSASCTMEIWVKVTGQWEGKIFTVLSQSNRSNCGSYWTLSNTNGNGAASYTSGTAAFTSSMPVYTSGSGLYGAVWNDYAEYRAAEILEPGRVIRESADGVMKLTNERLLPGCEIISDTFGFALGKTDECKTPIAATGRVLAYPLEDRDSFELGQAVCSGPNGTVSKMTREEIITYPERIIGTVSEIPKYETWGTDNIAVNGRIWIRIK